MTTTEKELEAKDHKETDDKRMAVRTGGGRIERLQPKSFIEL